MIPPPPRSTLFPYTTLFRSSQLVGQREPLSTAYGSPLVQRTIPLKPQLPTMAFTIPPLLPSQRLPWPVGRSHTQLALIWCVMSKSETPRSCAGIQLLMICALLSPPEVERRSACEVQ